MKSLKAFIKNNLEWLVVALVMALSAVFLLTGTLDENGFITLGGEVTIEESTKDFIDEAREALARIQNTDKPTDEETIKANDSEATGQGFHTTLADILARRKADGDNDGGNGWQCSKYTAYLATGKKDYSASHLDYGPVNGKDIAAWLVRNYGFKYISEPVEGAIGSGGFNTLYGHTVMYVGNGYVNDANWAPLTIGTHTMDLSGYVWVVPGDYEPTPTTPSEPEPTISTDTHTVVRGETLGGIIISEGWCNGCVLYGDNGYAQKLAESNGIKNRGLIYPGQVITRAE